MMDTFDLLDPQKVEILYRAVTSESGIGGWISFLVGLCMSFLLESLIMVRFLSQSFGFRKCIHPFCGYLTGTLLLFAATGLSWYIQILRQTSIKAIMGYGIHFLVLLLFAIVFMSGNICEKLFMAIICKTIEAVAEHAQQLLADLDGIKPLRGTAFIIDQIAFWLIYLVILFLLLEIVLRFHKSNLGSLRNTEWLILSGAFLMTWLLYFGMNRFSDGQIFLSIALINILLFVFVRKLHTAAQREHEQKLATVRMAQQQQEIDRMEKQHRALSILRHDTVHRMTCIRELLRQGEAERAAAYIEEFVGDQNSIPHIRSSSAVVNAVINTKFTEAQDRGILVSCQMTTMIPQVLEYDISILLSNLLDNALHACRKCDAPEILVSLTETGGYYRLEVSNTIEESVLSRNPKLTTEKADKSRHGFGLRSVSEIAASHEGTVHFSEKNGRFIASVLLMKPEKSNL